MRILSSIGGLAILLSALWASDTALAQSPPAPFPDVPPWHWAYQAVLKDEQAGLVIGYPSSPAELVATSITQVYDSFVHAHATGAQVVGRLHVIARKQQLFEDIDAVDQQPAQNAEPGHSE